MAVWRLPEALFTCIRPIPLSCTLHNSAFGLQVRVISRQYTYNTYMPLLTQHNTTYDHYKLTWQLYTGVLLAVKCHMSPSQKGTRTQAPQHERCVSHFFHASFNLLINLNMSFQPAGNSKNLMLIKSIT